MRPRAGFTLIETDFVLLKAEIRTKYDEGEMKAVTLHGGSTVRLGKTDPDYVLSNGRAVLDYLGATAARGEVATGLLYIEGTNEDVHSFENTVERPLVDVPYDVLCPGSAALDAIQEEWR